PAWVPYALASIADPCDERILDARRRWAIADADANADANANANANAKAKNADLALLHEELVVQYAFTVGGPAVDEVESVDAAPPFRGRDRDLDGNWRVGCQRGRGDLLAIPANAQHSSHARCAGQREGDRAGMLQGHDDPRLVGDGRAKVAARGAE